MTKYVTAILLIVVMIFSFTYAAADDLSGKSIEELYQLRESINNEIASRQSTVELQEGTPIQNIFPDKDLAKLVRDETGKISINDKVTQEDLDSVRSIYATRNEDIKSLEGIEYLRNLESLTMFGQKNLAYVPDTIGSLTSLKRIEFSESLFLEFLPDSICDLPALRSLNLRSSAIKALPDDIGNLTNLAEIDISYTNITDLPESIYALNLGTFNRTGLDFE